MLRLKPWPSIAVSSGLLAPDSHTGLRIQLANDVPKLLQPQPRGVCNDFFPETPAGLQGECSC